MNARPWFATNARNLLETRQQGLLPDGPVTVSLIGGEHPAPALFVRPDMPTERLDWRMLVNLEVWLYAGQSASLDWVAATAWCIAQARPRELVLRFEHSDELHDVDCGSGYHLQPVADVPAVHAFHWLPLNVGGTALGQRLRQALLNAHPGAVL